MAKIGNPERIRAVRKALEGLGWPAETKARVAHFVDAFDVLVHNRNHLDHSAFMEIAEATVLYKYDPKDGKRTQLVEVTPATLRQIADDMRTYYEYGQMVGNLIGPSGELIKALSPKWPDQPPLPTRLIYRSR